MPRTNTIAFTATAALTLLAVQTAVIQLASSDVAVRIVLPLTIGLAPLALWPHRHHIGVWTMFVGLAANLAVILANGGLMPIEESTVVRAIGAERAAEYELNAWMSGSKDVLVPNGGGRLTALGDSIIVRIGGGGLAASPGDIVVLAGVLLLAAEGAARWRMSHQREKREEIRTRALEAARSRAVGRASTPQ